MKYRYLKRIKDPITRALAESFGRLIVALRTEEKLARRIVCQQLEINGKRMKQLEEGTVIPRLDEVVKLAHLYEVSYASLLKETLQDGAFLKAYDQEVWLKV